MSQGIFMIPGSKGRDLCDPQKHENKARQGEKQGKETRK